MYQIAFTRSISDSRFDPEQSRFAPQGDRMVLLGTVCMPLTLRLEGTKPPVFSLEPTGPLNGGVFRSRLVTLSPDGNSFTLESVDGTQIFDLTKLRRAPIFLDHPGSVRFTPDGRRIATVGARSVKFWLNDQFDVDRAKRDAGTFRTTLPGQVAGTFESHVEIKQSAFASNANYMLLRTGGNICILDTTPTADFNPRPSYLLPAGSKSPIEDFVVMPRDSQVVTQEGASFSGWGTIGVWDIRSRERVATLSSPGRVVHISSSGQLIATEGDVGRILRKHRVVRVWDARTGSLLAEYQGCSGGRPYREVVFSGDETKAVTVDGSQPSATMVTVWEMPSGRRASNLKLPSNVSSGSLEVMFGPSSAVVTCPHSPYHSFRGSPG